MPLNDTVHQVTERIRARSRTARTAYLERMGRAADAGPARAHLSCGNLAHAFAASPAADKARQSEGSAVDGARNTAGPAEAPVRLVLDGPRPATVYWAP